MIKVIFCILNKRFGRGEVIDERELKGIFFLTEPAKRSGRA